MGINVSTLTSSCMMTTVQKQSACSADAAMDKLKALGNDSVMTQLKDSGSVSASELNALASLAEQSVQMGIDYRSLGLGWDHPETRTRYRRCQHPSTTSTASRKRQEESRAFINQMLASVAEGKVDMGDGIVTCFLDEIGVHRDSPVRAAATFLGIAAALDAELLLPLRALNEGQQYMHRTHSGDPVPPGPIASSVQALTAAVVSDPCGYSTWRYSNPVGLEQMRGLDEKQAAVWQEPSSMAHEGGLTTHEDNKGELGFFWATKIGGPSHGFDYEAQCLLPLLCNARSKVVLVSDPAWPDHPAGRAHFRCLWSHESTVVPGPRLWLESVHSDFDAAAQVDNSPWFKAVLRHAVMKSTKMQAPLLVDRHSLEDLKDIAAEYGGDTAVHEVCERLILRPSNGVCEASDYLSDKHDWVQLQEEVTEPLRRAMFQPPTPEFTSPSRMNVVDCVSAC